MPDNWWYNRDEEQREIERLFGGAGADLVMDVTDTTDFDAVVAEFLEPAQGLQAPPRYRYIAMLVFTLVIVLWVLLAVLI